VAQGGEPLPGLARAAFLAAPLVLPVGAHSPLAAWQPCVSLAAGILCTWRPSRPVRRGTFAP